MPILLIVFIAIWVSNSRLPRMMKNVLYFALVLRIVGSYGRYYMVTDMYDFTGDSFMYFEHGLAYASMLWSGDFATALEWTAEKWWGTPFVQFFTGLVLAGIGPTFFGAFLVFSLLAFAGLVGFTRAFQRAYPTVPAWKYARWALLFPSLWFWPSAIGKEAVVILGLGLAVAGFVGKNDRINWPLLLLGLGFVFAIRVQVAAVLIFALVFAYWLSFAGRWTPARVAQGVGILVIGVAGMQVALGEMGMDSFDGEGVQQYLTENAGRGGGGPQRGTLSAIEGAQVGLSGIPDALANILLRPFPWEARNPQLMITALEILAFWAIVYYRRSNVLAAIRHWRKERLLRLAVPFILVYAISLGMLLANMGLIARQRILIFPFLFFLVEAVPAAVRAARPQPAGEVGPVRSNRGIGPIRRPRFPATTPRILPRPE
jgi:hypothetical protein